MTDPEPALRVPAAARRVGLTTRDLYLRIDAGVLPAHRDARGMVVVEVDDLVDVPELPGD